MSRVLSWYSDGAASAVASYLAAGKYGDSCEIVKCDTTGDEHPDNLRFRGEVEAWIGHKVKLISSDKYAGIDEVFEKTRYMAGIGGARCTTELKKVPRYDYQHPDDIHVFGYTDDPNEHRRISRFEENNPELKCEWILRDYGITKEGCHEILRDAGIDLPVMYELGFDHNNCIACVKATSPGYWNRTRQHFPEAFERRARQSREIGAKLTRVRIPKEDPSERQKYKRIFLDELDPMYGLDMSDGNIECGPFCEVDPPEEDAA
jgi:hypothetical protein